MEYVAARQAQSTRFGNPPSNRTINIELSLLKRMLRLAYRNGKLLRVPPIDMLVEAPARSGFFEEAQYLAVRCHLPADLQTAIDIAFTFGWRLRSEILPLQRHQLDLKTKTFRLEPGTTKNREGRLVYLTPDLAVRLTEQVERVRVLERALGRIVPALFPICPARTLDSLDGISRSAGGVRASGRVSLAASRMTSGALPCAISNGAAWPGRWRPRSPDTRRRACTAATPW